MPPKTTETTPSVTAKRAERSRSRTKSTDDASTIGANGSAKDSPRSAAHPNVPPKLHELANAAFWSSLVVLPLGAAAVVGLLAGRSRTTRPLGVGASVAFTLGLMRWQMGRWFSEEPSYQVVDSVEDIEVRDYAPMVVAEATLPSSDWDSALNDGFRVLADYIFGKNASREKVAMTSPVQASDREPSHGSIPVPRADKSSRRESGGAHRTTFVMPEGRSLRSLPLPLDERIRLRHVASRRIAVLRFSGRYTEEHVREKMRELVAKSVRGGLALRGEPTFAGYDPPTTLPFLRRNEVWVEVGEA